MLQQQTRTDPWNYTSSVIFQLDRFFKTKLDRERQFAS
jgi:hypothetical protein